MLNENENRILKQSYLRNEILSRGFNPQNF